MFEGWAALAVAVGVIALVVVLAGLALFIIAYLDGSLRNGGK